VDGFLTAVRESESITDKQREEIVNMIQTLRNEDGWQDAVITVGLRQMYPKYQEALVALGEEDLQPAITKLNELAAAEDPFLAADVVFFLARANMILERYEQALPLLADLVENRADKTLHAAEALFLRGLTAARLLDRAVAIKSLNDYLEKNPDAPERMRFGAWRQLLILKSIEEGSIVDVQDRMEFSRRRLSLEEPGGRTREEQDKIVAMLDKLVEEAEKREAQCQCSGGGEGQSGGQSGGSSGGPDGQGAGQRGANDQTPYDAARRVHRGGPRSAWGQLRPRDRERVFAALKARFPSRYRQLIEQYYKSMIEEEENRE